MKNFLTSEEIDIICSLLEQEIILREEDESEEPVDALAYRKILEKLKKPPVLGKLKGYLKKIM